MYAYYIWGIVRKNEEELLEMSDETSPILDNVDGLVARYTFSNVEDGITSALFLCESQESAENVKVKVNEVIEDLDDVVGFTTEFIFKVIENVNYVPHENN